MAKIVTAALVAMSALTVMWFLKTSFDELLHVDFSYSTNTETTRSQESGPSTR